MEQFLFNLLISVLIGIPASILASYIYDKLQRHSSTRNRKSVIELEIKFKLKK